MSPIPRYAFFTTRYGQSKNKNWKHSKAVNFIECYLLIYFCTRFLDWRRNKVIRFM